MKQHVVRIAIGLAITLFFIGHAAELYPGWDGKLPFVNGKVPFITQLDNIIYDTRLKLTMPSGPFGKGPAGIVSLSRVS